jgi:two-component system, cell cycle response regulator
MKILIADDEKVSQLAIKRTLEKEKFNIELCKNGKKALEIINNDKDVRIVILNLSLPDMDGLSLCREIRRLSLFRYIYVIVILSGNREEVREAMEAGADDYINTPFENDFFMFRIKAGVRLLDVEEKLSKSQKELMRLVKEDSLTTLLNRRAFLDEAVKQLDRASRENHPMSAVIVDIDDFKSINELYGNYIGDRILVEFANRLRFGCRPYDIIGRYSGEEFFVLLPNAKVNNAVKIAKRLRSIVSKKYYDVQGRSVKITASFGVSFIHPDVGLKDRQIDILIKKTEVALRKAKSEGYDKIALNAEE